MKVVDGALIRKTWWRAEAVLPSGAAAEVLQLDVRERAGSAPENRMWLVVADDGRAVLKLNPLAWEERDLETLRDALKLEKRLEVVQSFREARVAHPDVVAWRHVHPMATAYAVIAVLCILFLLGSALLS